MTDKLEFSFVTSFKKVFENPLGMVTKQSIIIAKFKQFCFFWLYICTLKHSHSTLVRIWRCHNCLCFFHHLELWLVQSVIMYSLYREYAMCICECKYNVIFEYSHPIPAAIFLYIALATLWALFFNSLNYLLYLKFSYFAEGRLSDQIWSVHFTY